MTNDKTKVIYPNAGCLRTQIQPNSQKLATSWRAILHLSKARLLEAAGILNIMRDMHSE